MKVSIRKVLASVDMLARYHNIDYVEAVLSAENNRCIPGTLGKRFNLGRHGNSYFSKIFTRPATTAGASILAGQLLAENEEGIIFSPAGGNHHAKKNQAPVSVFLMTQFWVSSLCWIMD